VSRSKVVLTPPDLVPRVEAARRRGRTIVFANGCFELLHVGHVRYLAAARALGDLLIVAVNTDASIALIKPDRRPVNSETERFEIIAALDAVDFVIPLADRAPAALLHAFRPHIYAKGTDYTLEQLAPERAIVERYGGRVALVGGPKCRSTRAMLDLIRIPAAS
jgi:rfaE bifunctional protein nucleotidyltransferase chain/domain